MSTELSPKEETINANMEALRANTYPGRGIVMGFNTLGTVALQVYWVMGRSEGSRNRRLVAEEDVVRTVPHDPAKIKDPHLTIYNALRQAGEFHVVTNGKQTDSVAKALERIPDMRTAESALRTWTFEPDKPNFTPRISGILAVRAELEYGFSVISRNLEMGTYPDHNFYQGVIDPDEKGIGHCVHTYRGDGNPLPSFLGSPYPVKLGMGIDDTAEAYWDILDAQNRVSLVAKGINLATGEVNCRIINKLEAA